MENPTQVLAEIGQVQSLSQVAGLLNWDQQTYLPKRGGEARAKQRSALAAVIHSRLTAPDFIRQLEALFESSEVDSDLYVIAREQLETARLALARPPAMVEKLTMLESSLYDRWIEAREQNDFALVELLLAEMVDLKREEACVLTPVVGSTTPWEALLHLYDPGLKERTVFELFAVIQPELQKIIRETRLSGTESIKGFFAEDKQLQLFIDLLGRMGFDLERGRFDKTVHPFCETVGSQDIRLTYRCDPEDIVRALLPLIHEAGHGLYEQGFLPEYYGTPLAEARSLAIHESQSMIWEIQVARSKDFLSWLHPVLCSHFAEAMAEVTLEKLYQRINRVQRGLIRVESDEVTYGLHIIIRSELERRLINGTLEVSGLKFEWNRLYQELLGISVPDDRSGVLQDVHWFTGSFGYFPTYLLGAMNAAQLYRSFLLERPCYTDELTRGEFKPLTHWLAEKIYHQGRRFSTEQLMVRATGSPTSAEPYLDHLRRKFLG